MKLLKRTWAEIDLDALCENYQNIKLRAAERGITAVVKADAYGHGAAEIAPTLQSLGCESFAVSNIEEAVRLRDYGIKRPILILGYTPPEYADILAKNDITQAVFSYRYAEKLNCAALQKGVSVKCHIKVDTGMGRIGFDCRTDGGIESSLPEIAALKDLTGLEINGIFMHFSVADSPEHSDEEFCDSQYEKFSKTVSALKERGMDFKYVHCCNSAAMCLQEPARGNFVRPGNILYGLRPSTDISVGFELKPVMSLKSVVSMVKTIECGDYVSYGRTFRADKKMTVATVAIGYADGYPRGLSNKGRVIINGQYAPIIGRICMDQLVVDVSGITDVSEGDTVTLMGADGNASITADEIAEICSTINYEIVCGISQRVPRVYLKGGKRIAVREYKSLLI